MGTFLATDVRQNEDGSFSGGGVRTLGGGSPNLMLLMQFMSWKAKVDLAVAAYESLLLEYGPLVEELDARPETATLGKNYSWSNCKLNAVAEAINVSSDYTIDTTDVNTVGKSLAVNLVRPLGEVLGSMLRRQYTSVYAELEQLSIMASQKFWEAAGLDFGGNDSMMILLADKLNPARAALPALPA